MVALVVRVVMLNRPVFDRVRSFSAVIHGAGARPEAGRLQAAARRKSWNIRVFGGPWWNSSSWNRMECPSSFKGTEALQHVM